MSATKKFRDDHVRLLSMFDELGTVLGAGEKTVAENAAEISKKLSAFGGILKLHLAAEDKYLYPKLADSSDANVANIAKQFQQEMVGITDVFKNYSGKWNVATIATDPTGFIDETKQIVDAVKNRIDREENELYAAFDKLSAG